MSNNGEIPDEGFDLEAQMRAWENGEKVILEMSLARQAVQAAKTTRELAHAKVRIQERVIRRLFSSGVSRASILEGLSDAMPEIPKEELLRALDAIRVKMIRERKKAESHDGSELTPKVVPKSQSPAAIKTNSSKSAQEINKAIGGMSMPITKPLEITNPADGSDRMPGESEADYQLRKSLEPSPPAKNRFIGEG